MNGLATRNRIRQARRIDGSGHKRIDSIIGCVGCVGFAVLLISQLVFRAFS